MAPDGGGSKRTRVAASASVSHEQDGGSIIPCLPDDLALYILHRQPRSLQNRQRLVCHSWKDAMEPARMTSIRKSLNISEAWPVFVTRRDFPYKQSRSLFTIVDPIGCLRCIIPVPCQFPQHMHRYFHFSVMGTVGSKVLISVVLDTAKDETQLQLMQGVYSFDGLSMKWEDALYSSLPTTLTPTLKQTSAIAVDMNGGYLYVAGGYGQRGDDYMEGAGRLDIKTKMWEALPDPYVKRIAAVGVVMGGLFYIIGGTGKQESGSTYTYKPQQSGEIWDPATREWSLLPELWPDKVFIIRARTRVVALGDRLYALRRAGLSEELMYYESAFKAWMSLGFVPLDVPDDVSYNGIDIHDPVFVHLLKIGEELWVFHWWAHVCVATKPTLPRPLFWRTFRRTGKSPLPMYAGHMVGELHV
ncbi:hypothetical protein GOP47_0016177 [Adiantum capillus-veneris]|uniref:F-box domain-containing protein n=1 Tax=Adiantum capillus-veneris TaxID=13818 RepID=A0A9D4UL62_ADICA|nr:hypothetical protein GOP47_0016177 [Adiantum capillus-veneris]